MPRGKDHNTIDYLRNAYLRVVLSHPSSGGTERKVVEAEAEEFALIVLRYTQDDTVRISVNDRALHRMRRRVEAAWEMPHHREAAKDEVRKVKKVRRKNATNSRKAKVGGARDSTRSRTARVSSADSVESVADGARKKLERMRARKKRKSQ